MTNKALPDIQILADLANKIRIHSVVATSSSNAGYPTSCSSCAEIISVLFFQTMRYKIFDPRDPSSDRFILSKGHAAPALYAAWCEAGVVPECDLKTYMQFGSDLEGTPTPRLTFVDAATGSLGQGLAVACGMAYVGKYLDKADYRIFCLVGNRESSEGSIWESIQFAVFHKLDNLCLIVDVDENDTSSASSEYTSDRHKRKLESFGFHVEVVDGHNISELIYSFKVANTICGRPTAVLAKTVKGKNFYGIENVKIWNGRPLGKLTDLNLQHLRSLLKRKQSVPKIVFPNYTREVLPALINNIRLSSAPNYTRGDKESTASAYSTALVKIAQNNSKVVALDCEMSCGTEKFKQMFPERYIECLISEQSLVGTAVGASCRARSLPFASTYAAFLTRSHDQIRMAAVSQTNAKFVGSCCGVSVGSIGPSVMALEDLAMFRSIPDCTIFYPSDAVSTERAVELAANVEGMVYIRLTQPSTTVVYSNEHSFQIGKSSILTTISKNDVMLIIAPGILLQEALKAADILKNELSVRVMDLFTIKPLDVEGIKENARECGGRILVVEDHYSEGGVGEAVASIVAGERDLVMKHVAVPRIPRSGKPDILLDHYGLSARHMVEYIKEFSTK